MTEHVSALDLFTIGIGPSSSHTVGPMRAALLFREALSQPSADVNVTLYGSLGATGIGHGTINAILAGLQGMRPETCDPDAVRSLTELPQVHFTLAPRERLSKHSNAMKFESGDQTCIYYSVGGGFVETDATVTKPAWSVPYPYQTAAELLDICVREKLSIAQVGMANELAQRPDKDVDVELEKIWLAMKRCIEAGLSTSGVLPGFLKVERRAASLYRHLEANEGDQSMDALQAYAIAVNEENAAGNRVVTAPTNGAAGIIPAVAYYALKHRGISDAKLASEYLITAATIGGLYKRNASISGAEAGCQGEVGSACSMAAAGLAQVLGATAKQVENAAEIAMEHNLGLTCDPVGGFVQLPCIERNAIAAGTAVAAVRLALNGSGNHKISLDTVIETMRQTGQDMSTKYKETSTGGLAVNVVEC
ncbi:MAG: L-serine ammonia-lyase [Micrococcales bacterium]